jgi:hypothetical protein
MGKRELLLAAAFVLIGVLVYQVTAPAADPQRRGWSIGRIIDHVRREVRGNQAQASATHTTTITAPESLRDVRIEVGSQNLTLIGEDRADIQTELAVISRAFDQAEADKTAKETHVTVDESGSTVTLGIFFPEAGQQRASLTVRVPSRLEARIEKNNSLEVSNVAAVSVVGRSQTSIKNVSGEVQVEQRGSVLTLMDIGSLRVKTLGGTEVKVAGVRGDTILSLQGGELHAENIVGSLEIEARNTDITLEKIESPKPVRLNTVGGEVTVLGLKTELRIDGRETDIRVEQGAGAPLSIYNEGNESVELTLADGGVKIDAVTTDGRITVDEALQKSGVKVANGGSEGGETGSGRDEQRIAATVRGGGPTITIRVRGGDIVLRSRKSEVGSQK